MFMCLLYITELEMVLKMFVIFQSIKYDSQFHTEFITYRVGHIRVSLTSKKTPFNYQCLIYIVKIN